MLVPPPHIQRVGGGTLCCALMLHTSSCNLSFCLRVTISRYVCVTSENWNGFWTFPVNRGVKYSFMCMRKVDSTDAHRFLCNSQCSVQFLYVVLQRSYEIYIMDFFLLNYKILNILKIILDFCMFKCYLKTCTNGPLWLFDLKIRNLQSAKKMW